MKKQLIGFLLSAMVLFICVGCGAESITTNQNEQVTAITTEESTLEQTEAATVTPEETIEQTPEVTEEPSEETTDETEIVEVTINPSTKPEPTEEPEVKYTYTDMPATMYAQQTVNVRDLPDASGNKLGSLSTNDEITISAKCNETGWYRIEYNGSVAYVSNKYVGENMVEIQTTPADNSSSGAFNEADFPTPYQIINKGGLNVYFVMGTDADKNYDTKMQCIDTVGANLGIAMTYDGIGTYYFFGDYYNGGSNANGVTALFFPYYQDANGNWLGESPETQKKVY